MKHLTISITNYEITTPLVSENGQELDREQVVKYLKRLAKKNIERFAKFTEHDL